MNEHFFQKLYLGYTAESIITSQLFDQHLESFRLPADFGFDLVVTNLFRLASGNKIKKERFPFALQIKSRRFGDNWKIRTRLWDDVTASNECDIFFELNFKEFELIQSIENSACVFVVMFPHRMLSKFWHMIFLLYPKDISLLNELGYFTREKKILSLRLVLPERLFI